MEKALQLDRLKDEVSELTARIERLEASAPAVAVTFFVETFVPEPYTVKRPIPVVVQPRGDGYVASFVAANVNSSGDTQYEAYANVRELLLDVFDNLRSLPASKLGPGPSRQILVLRDYIDGPHDHKRARKKDS